MRSSVLPRSSYNTHPQRRGVRLHLPVILAIITSPSPRVMLPQHTTLSSTMVRLPSTPSPPTQHPPHSLSLSFLDAGCDNCGGVSDICGDCLDSGSGYAGPTNYRHQNQDTLDRSLLTLQLLHLLDTLKTVSTAIDETASKLRANYTSSTLDFTTAFNNVEQYETELESFDQFVQFVNQALNAKRRR